jgi:uncharacterized protein
MAVQFLIIDGYNVLHSCGLIRGKQIAEARARLLEHLRRNLDEPDRKRTTVVFDSNLPRETHSETVADVLVEFASDHPSADERIIQLIRKHSAPKQLLVISSDHEIQRAARSRGAKGVDSEVWFEKLVSGSPGESGRIGTKDPALAKPQNKPSAEEIRHWASLMGDVGVVPDEGNPGSGSAVTDGTTLTSAKDIFSGELLDELNRLFEKGGDS